MYFDVFCVFQWAPITILPPLVYGVAEKAKNASGQSPDVTFFWPTQVALYIASSERLGSYYLNIVTHQENK